MPTPVHRNHLVIGLGGTGGKIIRAMRKTSYQNYGDLVPGVNLNYLYVDSSNEYMDANDASWKILGNSVQLPPRSQMHISGMNLSNMVDNLPAFPGLRPWLGSRADWSDIISSAGAASINGGQKRRLGRFLFACQIDVFRKRVVTLVKEMQDHKSTTFPSSTETTFHVCCGLAGGTGSGCVADVITHIRDLFPSDQGHRIIVYAMLPERQPAPNKRGPNYHANGYAALVELNALAIGSWSPHDVSGVREGRMVVQDPFNCCYLLNDESEAKVPVNVDTELPEIAAAFLIQKIVEIQNVDWEDNNTLLRQETYELGPQAQTPEKTSKGQPRRARSFFSFGIKQLAYPEVEIHEYIAYCFAQQSVRQLLYNNWIDGRGYLGEANNLAFQDYVRQKATLERWSLTDERVTLSTGILKDEIGNPNWKAIPDFWAAAINYFNREVQQTYANEPKRMMNELASRCVTAFDEKFRELGVKQFYRIKRGDQDNQTREICSRVEADLFSEWQTGQRSMRDVSRILAALVDGLTDRLASIDDQITKHGENSESYRENEAKITHNDKQWANLGPLAIFMGKHKNLLNAQAQAFTFRYTMQTRAEGLRYAKELLGRVKQQMNGEVAAQASGCATLIADAEKRFDNAIANRLNDQGSNDFSRQVVRFYHPDAVRTFVRGLEADKTEQIKQTAAVREQLTARLGDRKTFTAFSNSISEDDLVDTIALSCKDSARQSHDQFVAADPGARPKVLQVSLMDMLKREMGGGDDTLRSYCKKIMDMSKDYLKLDNSQKMVSTTGIANAADDASAVCVSYLTIIAPGDPALEFRDKFCRFLVEADQGATAKIVTNAVRQQELTIINITSVFPARFVASVQFLRSEYESRMRKEAGTRAFLEVHSEGTDYKLEDGQQFFSLFADSYKAADLYPWVLLGEAIGLLTKLPDRTTGLERIYLITSDADGIPVTQDLGATIDEVVEKAKPETFEALQAEIEPVLLKNYGHISKKREIIEGLLTRVREMGKTLQPNDPQFQAYRGAIGQVREILGVRD